MSQDGKTPGGNAVQQRAHGRARAQTHNTHAQRNSQLPPIPSFSASAHFTQLMIRARDARDTSTIASLDSSRLAGRRLGGRSRSFAVTRESPKRTQGAARNSSVFPLTRGRIRVKVTRAGRAAVKSKSPPRRSDETPESRIIRVDGCRTLLRGCTTHLLTYSPAYLASTSWSLVLCWYARMSVVLLLRARDDECASRPAADLTNVRVTGAGYALPARRATQFPMESECRASARAHARRVSHDEPPQRFKWTHERNGRCSRCRYDGRDAHIHTFTHIRHALKLPPLLLLLPLFVLFCFYFSPLFRSFSFYFSLLCALPNGRRTSRRRWKNARSHVGCTSH